MSDTKEFLECPLSDKELIEKGKEWISKLCETGGKAWSLQIPVNLKKDPDIIFSELINRFQLTLKPLPLPETKVDWDELEKQYWNENFLHLGEVSGEMSTDWSRIINWFKSHFQNIPAENKQGWIKVEDGLPPERMDVNVATKQGVMAYTHYYSNNEWYGYGQSVKTYDITHWRRLPSPPTNI